MADYSKWRIADLKQELSNRKLPVSGTKADLIRRLEEDTPIVTSEPPPPPKKIISVHFDTLERVPTGLRTKTQEMFDKYDVPLITLKKFTKLIDDDTFLEKLRIASQKFAEYRIGCYQEQKKFMGAETQPSQSTSGSLGIFSAITGKDDGANYGSKLDSLISKLRKVSPTLSSLREGLREAITNPLKGLASLIGRQKEKEMIITIIYAFSKNYKTLMNSFRNFCILGKAGTGKTALAKVMAFVFLKSGMMASDRVLITSRSELVSEHIGKTAIATKKVLMKSLEGILVIDEAHELAYTSSTRDFGVEAIGEIVNHTDKFIGGCMIIAAGYRDKMKDNFLSSNQGLNRRFPYIMDLQDYSNEELTEILLKNIVDKSDVEISQEVANLAFSVVSDIQTPHPEAFSGQAGDILNLSSEIIRVTSSSIEDRSLEDPSEFRGLIITALRFYLNNKASKKAENPIIMSNY